MSHPRSGSTLARRLQLFLVLLAPVPVALLLAAAVEQYERRLDEEADRRLAALAKGAGHELHGRLERLEADLALLDGASVDVRLRTALGDRFPRAVKTACTVGAAPPGVPDFRPRFPDWPAISEIIAEWGTKMMLGEVTTEQGAKEIGGRMEEILAKSGYYDGTKKLLK